MSMWIAIAFVVGAILGGVVGYIRALLMCAKALKIAKERDDMMQACLTRAGETVALVNKSIATQREENQRAAKTVDEALKLVKGGRA